MLVLVGVMGWFFLLSHLVGRVGGRCGDTKVAASRKIWRVVQGGEEAGGRRSFRREISRGGGGKKNVLHPSVSGVLSTLCIGYYLGLFVPFATSLIENTFEKWQKSR